MGISSLRYQPIVNDRLFEHVALTGCNSTVERSELNGKRVYLVDGDVNSPLYSITTVLGVRSQGWVDEWKNAVGEEYAKSVSNLAANIGTAVHEMCEWYLSNKDINPKLKPNMILYHRFKKMKPVLDKFGKIYCLETPLFSKRLQVAGTVDCIAEYDGTLSVIDFKTSSKLKYEEEIPHYFAQATAYSMMFYEMYGIKVTQIVIIMSIDGEEPVVYKSSIGKYIDYLIESINMFKEEIKKDQK